MKLSRWFRHWGAKVLNGLSPEVGGMIHDYDNGRWILLHQWNDDAGQQLGLSIVENMLNGGRDAIHVVCIKSGPRKGFFVVYDSTRTVWMRCFWDGVYQPDEAFLDVRLYCRQVADKMGFRRLEV